MKIVSGSMTMEVQSIFSEHLYADGSVRPVLRMRFSQLPTTEQVEALCANPIQVKDDSGQAVSAYEGYNTLLDCSLAMVMSGGTEKEIELLTNRLAQLEKTQRTLESENAALEAEKAALQSFFSGQSPDPLLNSAQ